jgi:TatD DNase family protein
MFIDIHTHIQSAQPPNLCFLVGKHSLGIHPWSLTAERSIETIEVEFESLKRELTYSILAIGECGLDRSREGIADINMQMSVLEWHLDWALKVRRPVIIHCVKAHSDLLMMLKKKRYDGKLLLHDYAGNLNEAMKFLGYDVYFSFGARLFKENSKASTVYKNLPRERIFLETDDQKEISIEALYKKSEVILRMSQVELENLFFKNLLHFFNDLNNVSSSDLIAKLS